jgi:hypothetical protein
MAPVFFQFKKNNQVDTFLEIFEKNGWILPQSFSNTLTKYEWPDIVLSKEIIEGQLHIDLLGLYKFDGNSEGQIFLFYESIMQAAKDYYNTYPLGYNEKTLNSYFEDLSEVVLIHEFVHWLMHYIDCLEIDPYGTGVRAASYGSDFRNNTTDSVNFHEGLAELLTYLFIKDNKSLLDIFVWVNNQSPSQYQCYKNLINNGLDKIDLAVMYLNYYKINITDQSYDKFVDGLSKTPTMSSFSWLRESLLHQVLSIPDLSNCKEFIQACFQKTGGSCFIYIHEDLKKDKNFILSLLEIYSEVDNDEIPWLQYLPENLKMDKEFILEAIISSNGNVSVMKWMNRTCLSDENFVLDCIERTTFTNGFLLFYAPEKLYDKDFMLKAIKRNPQELLDASDLIKADSDILKILDELISKDKSLINIFLNDQIIKTELKLTAIKMKNSCDFTKEAEDFFEKFKAKNNCLYNTYKHEINKVFAYL